jgi:hypothetical protein
MDDILTNFETSQSGSSVEVEDKSSIGGGSINKDKEKGAVVPTTTVPPASEKIFEGNKDMSASSSTSNSASVVSMSLGDRSGSSNKGSRRTTSLLNLFIPQSQGMCL